MNACLRQPFSIVKVGDGAGEGREALLLHLARTGDLGAFYHEDWSSNPESIENPPVSRPTSQLPGKQRVPPQILHIPLLQNLQNGPFKAQAKRYSKRTHKNTGKFALF